MEISNEFMQQALAGGKPYTVFILKAGPKRHQPDADSIQWEHARYMFRLREEKKLAIVVAIMGEGDVMGVGIMNSSDPAEVGQLLDADPNVKAGRLVYELHAGISFPGDSLA